MRRKFTILPCISGLGSGFRTMLLLVMLSFASITVAVSQEVEDKKDISDQPAASSAESKEHLKLIRNQFATDVLVGKVLIDKRAAQYYPEGMLTEISESKAQKINFIYLHSFEMISPMKGLSETCRKYLKEEFDLGPYNAQRKFDARVEVAVTAGECQFVIQLHSWSEINSFGLE